MGPCPTLLCRACIYCRYPCPLASELLDTALGPADGIEMVKVRVLSCVRVCIYRLLEESLSWILFCVFPAFFGHRCALAARWHIRRLLHSPTSLLSSSVPLRAPTLSAYVFLFNNIGSGLKDELIPSWHMRSLYNASPESSGGGKRIFTVKDGTHNDTWERGGEEYLQALRSFMDEVSLR